MHIPFFHYLGFVENRRLGLMRSLFFNHHTTVTHTSAHTCSFCSRQIKSREEEKVFTKFSLCVVLNEQEKKRGKTFSFRFVMPRRTETATMPSVRSKCLISMNAVELLQKLPYNFVRLFLSFLTSLGFDVALEFRLHFVRRLCREQFVSPVCGVVVLHTLCMSSCCFVFFLFGFIICRNFRKWLAHAVDVFPVLRFLRFLCFSFFLFRCLYVCILVSYATHYLISLDKNSTRWDSNFWLALLRSLCHFLRLIHVFSSSRLIRILSQH